MQITKQSLEPYMKDYPKVLVDSLRIFQQKLPSLMGLFLDLKKSGGTVYVMGNGGSSSTASHFVNDLVKIGRIKAMCLTDNTPLLTAYANDLDYSQIFVELLRPVLRRNDLVVGISTSGRSRNVLKALKYAGKIGAFRLGFTGGNGGDLKDLVDLCLIVPSENTQRIEDIHLIFCHLIALMLKEGAKID